MHPSIVAVRVGAGIVLAVRSDNKSDNKSDQSATSTPSVSADLSHLASLGLSDESLAALTSHLYLDPSAPKPKAPPCGLMKAQQAARAEATRKVAEGELACQGVSEGRLSAGPLLLQPRRNAEQALAAMRKEGCCCMSNVVDKNTCEEALRQINEDLRAAVERSEEEGGEPLCRATGFGNVLARSQRWDMYLDWDREIFRHALGQMLLPPEKADFETDFETNAAAGQLGELFRALVEGGNPGSLAAMHEFSALVADPGAPRQPTHPDNKFESEGKGEAPLFTAFVALQDVDLEMGPTLMLPRTNLEAAHASFNEGGGEQKNFLEKCEYRSCCLKRGDAAVMDSRLLHCGTANTSDKRRVLMYVTFRNPKYGGPDVEQGSLLSGVDVTLEDWASGGKLRKVPAEKIHQQGK